MKRTPVKYPLLFALDPSVRSAGCAAFVDGVLRAAWRFTPELAPHVLADDPLAVGKRWSVIAREIFLEASGRGYVGGLVWERPQIYRASKSKGDPNDLIGLAAIGNGVACATKWPYGVLAPTPSQWTGQVKKSTKGSAWKSARGMRVASRLTPAEFVLVPDQHDVVDAVGLGLWALGRLEVTRVYSSS